MTTSALLGFALALAIATDAFGESPSTVVYEVSALRAHSYYPDLDQFDERDLLSGGLALRNTIIGEGDARAASSVSLVVVQVSGPEFTPSVRGSIELQALIEGGHELLRSSVPFMHLFSAKQQISVPFLVWGTGCGELTLKAKVDVEGKNAHSRTAVIGFRCGE